MTTNERSPDRGEMKARRVARVCLNGRFLTQRVTGIQRYSREVVSELDALLDSGAAPTNMDWAIIAPQGTTFPALRRIRCVHFGRLSGHAWEQLDLPRIAAGALLVGFSGTGPLIAHHQIVTVHGAAVYRVPEAFPWQFRVWYRFMVGRIVRRAPRTMVVSEFAAREAERWYGARRDRIDVTTEGWQHLLRTKTDDTVLQRHSLSPGSYVLAVSSPTPNKNFALVVAAMRQMRDVSLRFVIAGAVDKRALVLALDLDEERVTQVGYVSDGELKSLYENALCFVFPSKYEGFGIPPLEAMSLGCPVVASSIESVREVCADAALYFDPNDAVALAQILTRFGSQQSGGERERMRERGRQRAAEFSWRRSAERALATIIACSSSA